MVGSEFSIHLVGPFFSGSEVCFRGLSFRDTQYDTVLSVMQTAKQHRFEYGFYFAAKSILFDSNRA